MIANVSETQPACGLVPLNEAKLGCPLRICKLQGNGCRRLREMGFCEELKICKLSNGRNMVCAMCGTRLALSKKLAEQIMVETVD
jgi:ferrous iron transport protein A